MQTRKAASVLPDPVGAAISVWRPAAISCPPAACGSVGPAGKRPWNQARTAGWNDSSTRPRYLRAPTFHVTSRHQERFRRLSEYSALHTPVLLAKAYQAACGDDGSRTA